MQHGPAAIRAGRPVLVDWIHSVPRAAGPVALDGRLDSENWALGLFTTVTRPMFIKESWDWHGPQDGVFRFAVQQHGGVLHVAVETTDDKLVTAADPAALQDKIIVVLQTSGSTTTAEAVVGTKTKNTICQPRGESSGMVAQFALPLPAGEKTFRLNIGWVDVDRPENTKPSILWWRPPAALAFGQFLMDE